eukprot:CAMPEP_0117770404 /NCGR_PEP_ID=MMETSP0947-20121206/23754_1 /TAXON_ID=44440 /ORGANISM="Chattonella subsalsa, Strain CCMP2191" /LENGTH=62 /DNA_ID=CAMNT_0005595377 /DNA_START=96 /DNA_END=281 /DNA_ORIENTATION=+
MVVVIKKKSSITEQKILHGIDGYPDPVNLGLVRSDLLRPTEGRFQKVSAKVSEEIFRAPIDS